MMQYDKGGNVIGICVSKFHPLCCSSAQSAWRNQEYDSTRFADAILETLTNAPLIQPLVAFVGPHSYVHVRQHLLDGVLQQACLESIVSCMGEKHLGPYGIAAALRSTPR